MPHNDTAAPSLFVKLAAIKAVGQAVKEAEAATKAALEKIMDPGDRKTAALAGVDLGTISYAKTSTTAKVTDAKAFADWVHANHPTEVDAPTVTVPVDDLLAALLYAADEDAPNGRDQRKDWYDAHVRVRQIIAAVGRQPLRVRDSYTQHLLAIAEKHGEAIDPETGEVVPGITVTPGGEGKYVSARVSDAQRQAILEAYAAGRLDLLEVSTTEPPAIGPATS